MGNVKKNGFSGLILTWDMSSCSLLVWMVNVNGKFSWYSGEWIFVPKNFSWDENEVVTKEMSFGNLASVGTPWKYERQRLVNLTQVLPLLLIIWLWFYVSR